MANGIRTGDPRGLNKGRGSKFRVGSRIRQTPEEGRRTYRPKRCGNNNKDEDNSPKTLNDKNRLAILSKLKYFYFFFTDTNGKCSSIGKSPDFECIYVVIRILIILRRCTWCNGYRRRMWTRRHEFKSWT